MPRPARFDHAPAGSPDKDKDQDRDGDLTVDAAADYPLLRFRRERPDIVAETAERALSTVLRRTEPEYVLNDACLHEIRRLSESAPQEEVRELSEWKRLWRHLGGRSRPELLTELSKLVRDYAEDVAGGFSEPVYSLASHVLPRALALLLTPERLPSLGGHLLRPHKLDRFLGERLRVEGSLTHLRQLARGGRSTLVCVPTHLSNLDSPVMGYALQAAGLPPSTYGAGKNLFTNPVLGFFMRNLGAYRVDRRIRHDLYKDVLKTYSQVILERGYHSMFFPGGTRSRSGRVESHLKLGLLGTTLTATIEGLRRQAGLAPGPAVRPMYIVPVTINAQLVLEAETLIADYLKETGKARFIIDDDESTQWRRIVDFMRSTLSHTGAIVVRFGAPLDVLGNPVDEAGRSLGPGGHPVELARYFRWRGQIQHVPQRDAEYMHEAGEAITRSYRHNTVLMATHLLAHVMWRRIARALPKLDLYRRLRQPLDLVVPEAEVLSDLERLQALLRGRGHLLGPYASGTPKEALEAALAAFKSYHSAPAVLRQPPPELPGAPPGAPPGAAPSAAPAPSSSAPIEPGDRQLLFYYQNRVESLGVEL